MDIDDTENILNKSSENLPMIIEHNYSNDAELENLNKVLKFLKLRSGWRGGLRRGS